MCWGEGWKRSRIRQREALNCDTALTKAPGDPIENFGIDGPPELEPGVRFFAPI